MDALKFLKTLQFGYKSLGNHFHFKLRLNFEKAGTLVALASKHPEIKIFKTKAGMYIIGGIVHQSSPVKKVVEEMKKPKPYCELKKYSISKSIHHDNSNDKVHARTFHDRGL